MEPKAIFRSKSTAVEEVEAEVHQRINDLAPGGGFVLASVHNMQPDVPPPNIIAMARATRKFGNYPIQKS